MGSLKGKIGLIFGVANERSIAWGIAQKLAKEGVELIFTYAGEMLKRRVVPLAESVGSKIIKQCDVTNEADLDSLFKEIESVYGRLDMIVHSIAYANKDDLKNRFIETSREGFRVALDISAFSLIEIVRRSYPLMKGRNGSIVALTYYGAEKYVPNYNVMGVAKAALEASVRYLAADLGPEGIRVNAISAGPVKTLAAAGINNFKLLFSIVEEKAPLRRNVTLEEIGNAAYYLLSDLSSATTGEIIYVDSGYNIVGV